MIAPARPAHENERVAALHALNILDTPAEERFDRVTRFATQMYSVPIAYVSLIDTDRQWLKSSCGLTFKQSGRDESFCGHAILSDDAMVIPDATKDARFHDNPLVTGEPHIRFYAGYPLHDPKGHKLGTLCIADKQPRHLTIEDLAGLRELAGMIEREIELIDVIKLQEDLIVAETKAAEAERQRAAMLDRLVQSQAHLTRELNEAAKYVKSLLPAPLATGPVRTDWRFVPSSQLGGDAFGYHWIDDDHFAIYLLDVCGHGVGAAMLSVSAMNALRSNALPGVDFRDPAQVFNGLNRAFPMSRQDNKYFTIWYGVYNRPARHLRYSAAGHPPAVLLAGPDRDHAVPRQIGPQNFFIGLQDDAEFECGEAKLDSYARLFVFSDGAFEIRTPDGRMGSIDDLQRVLARSTQTPGSDVQRVLDSARWMRGGPSFEDDFSLVQLDFAAA